MRYEDELIFWDALFTHPGFHEKTKNGCIGLTLRTSNEGEWFACYVVDANGAETDFSLMKGFKKGSGPDEC